MKNLYISYSILETMDASLVSDLSIYIGLIQLKSVSIYFDLRVRNCNLDIEISLNIMKLKAHMMHSFLVMYFVVFLLRTINSNFLFFTLLLNLLHFVLYLVLSKFYNHFMDMFHCIVVFKISKKNLVYD